MKRIQEFYESLGYTSAHWHIGGEHPALEQHAIRWMKEKNRFRLLEIGYQSGGFSVPVISELHQQPGFRYVGIDSLIYPNAVNGRVIADYLKTQGITSGYEFRVSEATRGLKALHGQTFDLILIDHLKSLYPRDLEIALRLGLCAPDGVILMHDVLKRARWAWSYCRNIAVAYGCKTEVTAAVPEGLGIIHSAVSKRPVFMNRWIAKGLAIVAPGISEIQARVAYHCGRA